MTAAFRDHLNLDAIVAFADGEMPLVAYQRAAAHVSRCPQCDDEVNQQIVARSWLRAAGTPVDADEPAGQPEVDPGRRARRPAGRRRDDRPAHRPGRSGPTTHASGGHHRGWRFRFLGAGALVAGLAVGALVVGADQQDADSRPTANWSAGCDTVVVPVKLSAVVVRLTLRHAVRRSTARSRGTVGPPVAWRGSRDELSGRAAEPCRCAVSSHAPVERSPQQMNSPSPGARRRPDGAAGAGAARLRPTPAGRPQRPAAAGPEAAVEAARRSAAGRRVRPARRSGRVLRRRADRPARSLLGAPPVPEFLEDAFGRPAGGGDSLGRPPVATRRTPTTGAARRPVAGPERRRPARPAGPAGAGQATSPNPLPAERFTLRQALFERRLRPSARHRAAGRRAGGRRDRRGHRGVRREPAAGGGAPIPRSSWRPSRRPSPGSRVRSPTSPPGCCRRSSPWRSAPATSARPVRASSSTATATS